MNTTKESKEDKKERERLELEKDRRLLFGSSTPAKQAPLTARGNAADNEEAISKFRKEKEVVEVSSPRNMAKIPMSFGKDRTHLNECESPEIPIPGRM